MRNERLGIKPSVRESPRTTPVVGSESERLGRRWKAARMLYTRTPTDLPHLLDYLRARSNRLRRFNRMEKKRSYKHDGAKTESGGCDDGSGRGGLPEPGDITLVECEAQAR